MVFRFVDEKCGRIVIPDPFKSYSSIGCALRQVQILINCVVEGIKKVLRWVV